MLARKLCNTATDAALWQERFLREAKPAAVVPTESIINESAAKRLCFAAQGRSKNSPGRPHEDAKG
jgi:hypothetical protein